MGTGDTPRPCLSERMPRAPRAAQMPREAFPVSKSYPRLTFRSRSKLAWSNFWRYLLIELMFYFPKVSLE